MTEPVLEVYEEMGLELEESQIVETWFDDVKQLVVLPPGADDD